MTTSNAQKPSLYYLIQAPRIKTEGAPPLLILLHGVGSNEQDLYSLAADLPGKYLILSVRAPLTLGRGSYGWFHVDFSTGSPVINPGQAEGSRKLLLQFIDDLRQEFVFDAKQVYLLGFSQGGIMSYSVALTAPDRIAGIAVMSGRLLPQVEPLVAPEGSLQKLRIFISHGTQDPVLGIRYAREAISFLRSKQLAPETHEYNAGHGISPEMLRDVSKWLE